MHLKLALLFSLAAAAAVATSVPALARPATDDGARIVAAGVVTESESGDDSAVEEDIEVIDETFVEDETEFVDEIGVEDEVDLGGATDAGDDSELVDETGVEDDPEYAGETPGDEDEMLDLVDGSGELEDEGTGEDDAASYDDDALENELDASGAWGGRIAVAPVLRNEP
jgi:hypothetical protein